jgi:hypothetical protein
METSTKSGFIYYGYVSVISALSIYLIMNWLNWPVVASISLGIVLFVHTLFLAKSLKVLFEQAKEKGITEQPTEYLRNYYSVTSENRKSEI